MKALIYSPLTRTYRSGEMTMTEYYKAQIKYGFVNVSVCPEIKTCETYYFGSKRIAEKHKSAFADRGFTTVLVDTHETNHVSGRPRYKIIVSNPGLSVVDFLNELEDVLILVNSK